MFIDSHTHLFLEQFDGDRNDIVNRAIDAGVEKMLLPNIDSSTVSDMLSMCDSFPGNCYPMIGLHPCSVDESYEKQLAELFREADKSRYIAIGEIGLDKHWDTTFFKQQVDAFRTQVEWSGKMELPLVIHSRESTDDILDILEEIGDSSLTGVFHCFTGDLRQARRVEDLGFYVGIGGVVTFKNSGLSDVLKTISKEKVLLETDSPYLAPVPYRGKRNESSYIPYVAQKVAEIYELSIEEIENITTENARRLFNI